MNEKIIGILGGMGPAATHEIFGKIIKHTQGNSDKDHIHIIIDNNTKIPDRTKAILEGGASPIKEMILTAQNLQKAGVDFIIIPCMTTHFFIEKIQQALNIPIINAIVETDKYIDRHYPNIRKLGLLATNGTVKTNLFQNNLQNKEVIVPEEKLQNEGVMNAIYGADGIKAGNTSVQVIEKLTNVVLALKKRGAEAIISGCTEISLVLPPPIVAGIPLIDPLDILSQRAVEIAKNL